MYELNRLEITKLWRAPYAVRLAHVAALHEAASTLPLLARRLKVAAETIRGLPESCLPADRVILAIETTKGGNTVWLRGPTSGVGEDAIEESCAKIRLEGAPGASSDGPIVIDLEEWLPYWRDLA